MNGTGTDNGTIVLLIVLVIANIIIIGIVSTIVSDINGMNVLGLLNLAVLCTCLKTLCIGMHIKEIYTSFTVNVHFSRQLQLFHVTNANCNAKCKCYFLHS